jgi:hypothetical protein
LQIIAPAANQRSFTNSIQAILVLLDAQPHHFITQTPKRPHTPSNVNGDPSIDHHSHLNTTRLSSTLAAHVYLQHQSRDVHAVLMELARLLASSRLP